MTLSLKEWSKSIKNMDKIMQNDIGKMQTEIFMRDPIRAMYQNPNYFYSPADGIILYSDTYEPTEKVLEIKGMKYSLQDMMEDNKFNQTCMVIGIFMTYLDVHINRVPYGGFLKYRMLTPTMSYNRPMVFTENDLIDDNVAKLYHSMDYIKTNSRMLNTFYNPNLDYTYYVTQIADQEVNVITHFSTNQNTWFNQNQRFSFVRWGSQVELILPSDKRYEFKSLVPNLHHVEGCKDKLIEIVKK